MSSISKPHTYEEAISDENLKNVVEAELIALMKTNAWKLVHLPAHKSSIGCKWVFKLKLHDNGFVDRYMEKLMAKGFTQTKDLTYLDNLNPILKVTTITIFMEIAAKTSLYFNLMSRLPSYTVISMKRSICKFVMVFTYHILTWWESYKDHVII